jgi:hypothetical protein
MRVAQRRLVIKYGFPPKKLAEETLADKSTATLEQTGIQNREVLHIERQSDLPDATACNPLATSPKASPSNKNKRIAGSPSSSSRSNSNATTRVHIDKSGMVRHRKVAKRKKRIVMPKAGTGYTLAGDIGGTQQAQAQQANSNEDYVLGRAESSHDAATARIGAELVAAGRGSGSQDVLQSSALKSLRKSFRAARQQHGQWVDAEEKVAACMGGKTRFEALADQSGRIRCIYMKPGGRKEREECVSDIPAFLLKAILKQIARDKDELQVQNLKPVAMALVSPRVFWAVVRHGQVGPQTSFSQALQNLVPEIDWVQLIEQRKRVKPEKYGDYVST